jgi:hypothetical protein
MHNRRCTDLHYIAKKSSDEPRIDGCVIIKQCCSGYLENRICAP